jgi:hypothetical protein
MSTSNTRTDETLTTVEVMRRQEDTGYAVSDYLSQLPASATLAEHPVDAQCRMVMHKWCKEIVQFCSYNQETADIAMNCLDRFMATPNGFTILYDRSQYQLAAMTALYSSIKIHEHEAMDPKLVSNLSQGAHSPEAVEAMESRMLQAIQWKVNPPTSMSFVRKILDLVPEHLLSTSERQTVIDLAKFQVELAMDKYEFCMMPASSIAVASLLNAVESVSSDGMFLAEFETTACNITRVKRKSLDSIRIHLYESINGTEPMDVHCSCDSVAHGGDTSRCVKGNLYNSAHGDGKSPRAVST